MGDATNMVIILGGELLKKAEHLLIMGLHPSEVIKGYELACTKALSELESAFFSFIPNQYLVGSRFTQTRAIDDKPAFAINTVVVGFGIETSYCLKAVRLRRCIVRTCCRGSPGSHADKSKKLQRR